MSNKGLKIIIAGGGTGGHIFPAVAIANAIKDIEPNTQFLFVGAKGKMEMEKVPQAGFEIIGLDIAGFNRSAIWKNIGLPFKLLKSFFQVKKIFKQFIPDAVLGVGGYSTFPVLKYAQANAIPTFIHESNSFAGKANKMLSKNVTKAYVAAEGMEQFFPKEKIMITGNPVRKEIKYANVNRIDALQFFGLDTHKKTVLSIGGSLGAKSINEAVGAGLDELVANNLQIIWQTGKPYAATAQQQAAGKNGVYTSDFIKEIHYAYAAADVVISRAGAMAIAELSSVAKPAVLVPYPFAAEDHQTANAQYLVNKNAAVMIADAAATKELLATVLALVNDENKQQQLSNNIKLLATPNAAEQVANDILKTIQQ